MKLKKAIKKYVKLVNYREKFFGDSISYKNATSEIKYLEDVIIQKLDKEEDK